MGVLFFGILHSASRIPHLPFLVLNTHVDHNACQLPNISQLAQASLEVSGLHQQAHQYTLSAIMSQTC